MSLATRCTACGTVFRVVQDQLKVSEGWVRCGRCNEVFNALEGLFDLEGTSGPTPLARDPDEPVGSAAGGLSAPAPATAPAPMPEPPAEPAAPAPGGHVHSGPATDTTGVIHPPDGADGNGAAAPEDDSASTLIDSRADTSGDGRSRPEDEDTDDEHDRTTLDSRARYDTIDSEVPDEVLQAPDPAPAEPTPGFLRAERAAAAWQRPRVQRSLKVLAGLLAIGLAIQVSIAQHDTLAARWPALSPWLAALCMGCTIEPPRELEMLAVESSGLSRVEGSPAYRLQVALRNRGAQPVSMPALDLTLTDLRGDVIVRRVLAPADLAGSTAPRSLGGGAAWSVTAMLEVGTDVRVAGYTVELFYP